MGNNFEDEKQVHLYFRAFKRLNVSGGRGVAAQHGKAGRDPHQGGNCQINHYHHDSNVMLSSSSS